MDGSRGTQRPRWFSFVLWLHPYLIASLSCLFLLRNSPTSLTCGVLEYCYGKSTRTAEYLTPEWYGRQDSAVCQIFIHLLSSSPSLSLSTLSFPFSTTLSHPQARKWHQAACRKGVQNGQSRRLSGYCVPNYAWVLEWGTQQPTQLHTHHEVTGLHFLAYMTVTRWALQPLHFLLLYLSTLNTFSSILILNDEIDGLLYIFLNILK